MATEDILIVGAGPFGLSISAHLRGLGVDHRIVGRPLDTWRAHMPPGTKLRSEPYGSDMSAPKPGYDLAAYSAKHGLDFVARLGPLSIERFLDYGAWFIDQLVGPVDDVTVTDIEAVDGGFRVSFADAAPITARKVVVATGVLPYVRMPAELSGLPADLVSHSSDHHDLSRFRGKRVAVVGGGQSALETAALLHEAGADTRVVVRRPGVNWLEPNPERISRLGHLRRPVNKLCEGWHCAVWNSPTAFRRLPQDVRLDKAKNTLGPAGAWWLKDRVDGVIEMITSHQVRQAAPEGSGVRLHLDGPDLSVLDVDHVVAGTGFRLDIARLPFLGGPLVQRIVTLDGYPLTNRAGESSVRGLHFAGAPASVNLGPSVRFIAGTHNSARPLARSLKQGSRQAGAVSASESSEPVSGPRGETPAVR